MARRPRIFVPGHPVHVVQRGNNKGQVFFSSKDAESYLGWLKEAAVEHGLAVHAYVLMNNHVHMLLTPETAFSLPRAMRDLNWAYTRHVNQAQGRTGGLWEGRYKACVVNAEDYFFACSRYIELNPVRAGLAKTPGAYRWSSYKHNAEAKDDAVIRPHALYTAQGATPEARAAAYKTLFDGALGAETLEAIRAALNGGWALGKDAFRALVDRHAGRPLSSPRRRGRPRLMHALAS